MVACMDIAVSLHHIWLAQQPAKPKSGSQRPLPRNKIRHSPALCRDSAVRAMIAKMSILVSHLRTPHKWVR
jgi:hypothetical protein